MAKKSIWPVDATLVSVFNSGLEVWLYDDANLEAIRTSGATQDFDEAGLKALFADGLLAAYALYQDDGLRVAVIVGEKPSAKDLASGEWLDPQTAFLRLPSGQLCIESNDASRIGPEEPGDDGARVTVPPGDYRLTLYRVDYEALERKERTWKGPQEVVVLTPGGTAADAAIEILPFEQRSDTAWVDSYTIDGRTFNGLAWFDDYWDTFTVNIDRRAIDTLGLTPGTCLRTTVPKAKIALVSAYAASWKDAMALQPPDGVPLEEYGFAQLSPMARWNGAEALFCRRDRTKTGIKSPQKKVWLPCTVEVLDARAEPPSRVRGPLIHDAGVRAFWRGELRERHYYEDLQALTAKLMGRVEGVPWGEPTPLARAIDMIDAAMAPLGLQPLGDFAFDVTSRQGSAEYTNRLYAGPADVIAAIWGSRGVFEIFFFSPLSDGTWLLTGTVSPRVAEAISARKGLSVHAGQGRLAAILDAHRGHLAGAGAVSLTTPTDLAAGVVLYEEYLKTALD